MDVTTAIQVEENEYTKERIKKLEKSVEALQKKQEETAQTTDKTMSKIDQVQITADVARTTAIAAKEKATEVEKQIKDLVLDNNTKFAANIGETANLKSMMKQQNNDMNTKLDNNMTAMNTKLDTMMHKMMNMFANQHATPTSTIANDTQLTTAAVPPEENNEVSVPQDQPASPFPIFPRNETTPKQNDVPINIVTPTNNTDNVSSITSADPPNVKQKKSTNEPLTPSKLQQKEVQSFFQQTTATQSSSSPTGSPPKK